MVHADACCAARGGEEPFSEQPQVPQRTPAWYAQGKEVLTASEFGTLFGSPRAWSQLVAHKVPTPEGAARPADESPGLYDV